MIARLAWKNLTRERVRLVISAGGVAFAVVLILLVRGLYNGFTTQATEWIEKVGGDVWVAQGGTPGDLFHSVSLLPNSLERDLERVDGVGEAVPVVVRAVVFEVAGKTRDFRLIGVDPAQPYAQPPGMERGEPVPGAGEIVIDRVFARNTGIGIGDTLTIERRALRVTGIARGGNTIISQYAWASLADARAVLGLREVTNYFVVRTEDGDDAAVVAARIAAEVPGTKPMVEDDFVDRNLADLEEGFLPIVLVLVVVAFVIGTAVIGLTIYTATLEKRREYGVMKAIGISNGRLFGIVYLQSLLAALGGLALGIAATYALSALIEALVPSFVTVVDRGDVVLVAAAALAMSGLSALLPMRPVARLDPAAVFRV